MFRLTDMSLTLGTWGDPPLDEKTLLEAGRRLARWAGREEVALRVEASTRWQRDAALLADLAGHAADGAPLTPVARVQPRVELLREAAALGAREVVLPLPVSEALARHQYLARGLEQASEHAVRMVRDAALAGLRPELALLDMPRADEATVRRVVAEARREADVRGVPLRLRLVDTAGLADPAPGVRRPLSLAGWVRLLTGELGVQAVGIAVQAANLRGLALGNARAAMLEGAEAAASFFGFGLGAGWTASEALLASVAGAPSARELVALRPLLDPRGLRTRGRRPVSGERAWQIEGGSTPEDRVDRYGEAFGVDPKKAFGIDPEPVLTPLSGHAGMLHLMHRHYPEAHFESQDPRSLEISAAFERQFAEGREQPVTWDEVEAPLRKAGVLPEGT